MNLKSGISKRLKMHFILDCDALIRIKGVLDKAAEELNEQLKVVFYIEREDDRFYETTAIEDVVSDANIAGKRVKLVSIEIRKNETDLNNYREWIAKVAFIAGREVYPYYRDQDEINIDIIASDRNWALLLADSLEPQIARTTNHSKLPRWPLYCFLGLIFYELVYKIYSHLKCNIPEDKVGYVLDLSVVFLFLFSVLVLLFLSYFSRYKRQFINKIIGPESVFLWGEEERRYSEREKTRHNIFWGVMVAFIVSILSTVALTLF